MAAGTKVTADGRGARPRRRQRDPAARARRLAGPRRSRVRERGPLGARARLPPRRHGAGVRQRGERRARPARERRPARGRLHHDEVPPRPQGPGGRGAAQPRAARCRPCRPLHRPLARGRTDLGVGRHAARAGGRARALDRRVELQRGRGRRAPGRRRRAARRQPGPVQPVRVPPRAARGQRGARHRARGLQPARHRPPPRRPAGRARSPTAPAARRRRS